MFSPTCQYALRALVFLAQNSGAGPVQVRDIAAAEEIPRSFLSKILQQLAQRGLVRSQKGPGGGFALAREASQLSIAEVAAAVDGVPEATRRCLLGMSECSDASACVLHEAWKRFRNDYDRTIGALTLAQLAERRRTVRDAEERGSARDAERRRSSGDTERRRSAGDAESRHDPR